MEIVTIAILLMILFAIWIVSIQRKLAMMDAHINSAMNQIGIQISLCFDALLSLLDQAERYAAEESQTLILEVKTQQSAITAESMPEEVMRQERIISETLGRIIAMAERCPELKADKNYIRYRDALDCYKGMAHTGCLIYNDSVVRFNQSLRRVPTGLIAKMLGFRKRGYLNAMVHD